MLAMTPATKVPWPKPARRDNFTITTLTKHVESCNIYWDQGSGLFVLLTIIKCLLIGPVGPFLHVLKMRVLLTQARIKDRHLHPGTYTATGETGQVGAQLDRVRTERAAPTRMAHLPKNICLEDLGDVAGDGPQQPPAGVAPGGVPEARAQRQAASPERTGRLPRLPLLRLGAGVARSSGFCCFRDRSRAVTGRSVPAPLVSGAHKTTRGAHLHTCAAVGMQMWPHN